MTRKERDVTRRQEIDAMIYAHTGHEHVDLAGAVDVLVWQYEHKAKIEERDRIRARIGLWEVEERQAEAQPAPVAGEEAAVARTAAACHAKWARENPWDEGATKTENESANRRIAQPVDSYRLTEDEWHTIMLALAFGSSAQARTDARVVIEKYRGVR